MFRKSRRIVNRRIKTQKSFHDLIIMYVYFAHSRGEKLTDWRKDRIAVRRNERSANKCQPEQQHVAAAQGEQREKERKVRKASYPTN